MLRGHGVQNEMKTVEMFFHLVGVLGIDHFIRAEPQGVFDLVWRRGKDDDVRAKSLRQFHAHVTKPAQPDDADFLTFGDLVMAQRRISRDARAEQRSGGGAIQIFRDAQHERLVHDDAVGNNRHQVMPPEILSGAL